MTENMNKRKVDLGEPIHWTDEELDAMSEVTLEDIEAAKALWRAGAPKRFKKLLDAEPQEPNGEQT